MIMLVENRGAKVHWMEPRDLSLADMDLRVSSPAGVSSPYDDPAVVMYMFTTPFEGRPVPAKVPGRPTWRKRNP